MDIGYDNKYNVFLIKPGHNEYDRIADIPEKRWRKHTAIFAAPCLRRNIEWMRKHLRNEEWYTKEALEALNADLNEPEAMSKFPEWFKFKNDPLPFQMADLNRAYSKDHYGLFYEQGLGKTFTSIQLCSAWATEGKIESVLVICPSSIKVVWPDELEEHCSIPCVSHVAMAGKYKALEKFISKKDGFQWLVAGIEGLSQGKLFSYLRRYVSNRKCAIILDESSRIKNPTKVRTEACLKLSGFAAKSLILSGTSITTGIENLYSQIKFLDPHIIGFHSFFSFRNYFCQMINMEVKPGVNVAKVVGYKNVDEFVNTLSPHVSRVEKKDVQDQLKGYSSNKQFEFRTIAMNPTQRKIGTSITTGIENLYSQIKFLDPHIIGFHSFFSFRNYFCQMINMEVKPGVNVAKVVGYKNVDEFVDIVSPHVSRVEKKDVQDQLKGYSSNKQFEFRTIAMNPTQRKIYKQLSEEYAFELNDSWYEAESVLEQRLRLLQVTGGFYPHDNGKTIEPKPIPGKNPKLEELIAMLDGISGKVIVWFLFRCELQLAADKLGDRALQFHGGCDDLEKKHAYKEFKNGEAKILLATRAAAYGLTLVSSSDAIYFSQDYSLEVYSQSQDRIDRIGQTEICNYTHLQCENTIDQKIYKRLVENQKIASGIYDRLKHKGD